MITVNDQELMRGVEKAVRIALNLRSNTELLPTTTIVGDLGAESIDLFDIACELEKVVGKELDFGQLLDTKQEKSHGGSDLTLQDLVDGLKRQMGS